MLDLNIPQISATAGPTGEGIVRGSIAQSAVLSAQSSVIFAQQTFAIRRDNSGSGDAYTDVTSTAAPTGTPVANAFLPWGADGAFSANDELWLAAEPTRDVCAFWIQIDTPGAWTGTGLQILESTDGSTLTPVANLVDPTNGFRSAAGFYLITFDVSPNRAAIAPFVGGTRRRYIVVRPNGLTAATTAPKMRRIWLTCPDNQTVHNDVTPILTGPTNSNTTFAALPNEVFLETKTLTYACLPGLSMGVDLYVFRRGGGTYTGVWEYLNSGGTWAALPNIVDPSDAVRNGPTVTSVTPTIFKMRWSVPNDWTSQALALSPQAAVTGYWMRFRFLTVTTPGPQDTPFYRVRSRSFGSGLASGIYHREARTYQTLTYDLGIAPTTNTVISFTDALTGTSATATFPANVASSGGTTSGRLDLNLAIQAGGQLLINHVSGGSITDAELHLS